MWGGASRVTAIVEPPSGARVKESHTRGAGVRGANRLPPERFQSAGAPIPMQERSPGELGTGKLMFTEAEPAQDAAEVEQRQGGLGDPKGTAG